MVNVGFWGVELGTKQERHRFGSEGIGESVWDNIERRNDIVRD